MISATMQPRLWKGRIPWGFLRLGPFGRRRVARPQLGHDALLSGTMNAGGVEMGIPRLGIRLHGGLPTARCVALATAAEAHGLASVWFAENPLERGTLPAIAACAAVT